MIEKNSIENILKDKRLMHNLFQTKYLTMKKFFTPYNLPVSIDVALLLIRLVCGYAFILHGWNKIQNPFHWMGPDSATPAIFQALAALSEFGGGIALITGLIARLASLGILSTMAVAVYTHAVAMGDPFYKAVPARAARRRGPRR